MEEKERLEILEKTAPGTPLRQAIDLVVQLGKGGLIVVAEREVISPLVVAGFELNTPFTPQAVAELSKMDRAVVVDPGLRTILYANAHLAPDPSIPSFETGTRHRAAEQTARQLGCPVIAISEERRRTTIYLGDWKHELQDPMTLLSQASQALLILDRYRAELNELLTELGPLEFERRVFPYHVALIIQKIVQMLELEEELKRIFLELGTYRELPQRQLRGLMRGVREELELIVLDFQKDQERPVEEVIQGILKMSVEDRLSPEAVLKHLGFDEDDLEKPLSSRGYRLLHKIPRLPMPVIERLVREFGSVDQIERQGRRQLQRIKGVAEVRARAIKAGLRRFKAGYATGLEGF
ncbi:MAG: DNA integrity scanning protein DisA [Acetothermia bacterium 64_32]|nr:MAG: DNA integrity scanning protein DisA [Acetothermia bacterium 64_32]MBC7098464.1 DNA integrity scanning protein DisA [Candidatus Bipolaricaulota bacterium]HAF70032.1 DNA integrity scanning protein DisA [Candidatus Acetothermia bacterium]